MHSLWQSIIRMSAFIRKEISEVLRQPRLLFTLVLGPFLILLIFGIGYRNVAPSLRTLFVVDPNSPLSSQIQEEATSLGEQLVYEGVTGDLDAALARLRRGDVDLVAVVPTDAYNQIRSSQQAMFTLYHQEIDPYRVDYVKYFGQVYIDEINRRLLLAMIQQGQADASTVKGDISSARANAAAMRQAIQAGDEVGARQSQTQLSGNVNSISLALGASLGLLSSVQGNLNGGATNPGDDAAAILASLTDARENSDALSASNDGQQPNQSERTQRLDQVEADLAKLDEQLGEFTSISPNVLVRPFGSETRSIARIQLKPIDFYAPAVVALLLQHLAITFAALSIVRERSVGTMELFRVSPLSAAETLLGKYISYFLFAGVLTAILTLLLVYGLKVPMLGNWPNYILVVAALIFTSLGIGFVISLISQTDSQAVQYTMILLLTSVFFSGFLMSLELIWKPVRVLSWSLPTTYGIVMLRDIMLRGNPPVLILLLGLTAIGLGLAFLAWLLLRRMITTQ